MAWDLCVFIGSMTFGEFYNSQNNIVSIASISDLGVVSSVMQVIETTEVFFYDSSKIPTEGHGLHVSVRLWCVSTELENLCNNSQKNTNFNVIFGNIHIFEHSCVLLIGFPHLRLW